MKANELRIGNYVSWRDEESKDSILTVTGIVLNDCVWVEWEWEDGEKDYTECDFDGLKPILITEDWLIRFGFEVGKGSTVWANKKELNYISSNEYQIFKNEISIADFKFVYLNDNLISEIKYLHQLQNIFYCLCGYELTIKE
jgi:hypothetical protein